jgi:putative ABC transport system permease protein
LRLIRRRPAPAAAIILTLAGAIAAVTTTIAVAAAVLWRPLPFAHADRLVFAWENTGASGGTEPARVTGSRFGEWEHETRALSSVAAFGSVGFLAEGASGPAIVDGVRVTTNYFSTLGIRPALGRDFTAADGEPGATRVVILSSGLWRDWFGGRADVIGADVRLARLPFTIVGVMPDGVYPAWPENPATVTLEPESRRLWVPIARTAAFASNSRAHVLGVVGRLADGRSIADAESELTGMAHASDPDAHGATLRPFRDQFVRDARLPLFALLGAAAAVLLVAAANLTALQGSGIEQRRTELGVRAALGAGRARLARQLVTESAMLAAVAAAAGLAMSKAALAYIPSLLPPSVPLLTAPSLDARTLLCVFAVSAFGTVILAAWPFVRMRQSTSPAPRGMAPLARSRWFRVAVVAQVAFTMALVSAAALLQQSLDAVRRQHAGFAVDNVLVARVTLAGTAYNTSTARVLTVERELTDALGHLPGAAGAAFAYDHPLEASWVDAFTLSGSAASRDDASNAAQLRIVSPSYFATMGVTLVSGRSFTEQDDYSHDGAALVNEAFAARLQDGPALDRVLRTGSTAGARPDVRLPAAFRIVGIVGNERFRGLEAPSEPAVYISTRQFPQLQLVMLLRTVADPMGLAAPARRTIRRIDAGLPVDTVSTLSAILAAQMVTRRATTHVLNGLAAAAVALAALGLYGLLALLVASGIRDTGIRLALGSSPTIEARRIVQTCLGWTLLGVAGGLALAVPAGRLVQALLVGVSPEDGPTLVRAAAVIAAAALAAAMLPAWRAARVDPSAALRQG